MWHDSETLKYLYLLFDEENKFNHNHVMTTEAHLFPIVSPLYHGLCIFFVVLPLPLHETLVDTHSLADQHPRIPGDGSETCPPFPMDIAIQRSDLFKRIDASFVRMYKGLQHALPTFCLSTRLVFMENEEQQDFITKTSKSDYCLHRLYLEP